MFLFRPWRKPLAEMKLSCKLDACREDVDAAYAAIWTEYQRWIKDDMEAVALPYYSGDLAPSAWPKYSNVDHTWWACLILPRFRQWRFALQRVQDTVPMTTVGDVHVISDDDMSNGDGRGSDADGRDCADDTNCAEGVGLGEDQADQTEARVDRKFATPTALRCSYVPAIRLGHDFFLNHPVFRT